jgi:hypothetical protein
MSYLIKAGERYSVLDHRCLGADCLALGCYQRRPPEESRGYDRVLERQRKEEGIRILKP